jgi:hypothetical protein
LGVVNHCTPECTRVLQLSGVSLHKKLAWPRTVILQDTENISEI